MKKDSRLESIRDDMNESFDSLGCFLMRHPGDGLYEKDFDGSVRFLHQDFVATLENFVESVLCPENLVPKKINGVAVNLADYVNNFQFFAEYFRENELPVPENFTAAIANNNSLNAVKAAMEEYQTKMMNLPRNLDSIDNLDHIHRKVHNEVLSRFDARTKFGINHAKSYRRELDHLISQIYEKIKKEILGRLAGNVVEADVQAVAVREGYMSYLKKYFKVVLCAIEEMYSYLAQKLRPAIDELVNGVTDEAVELAKRAASELIRRIFRRLVKMLGNAA